MFVAWASALRALRARGQWEEALQVLGRTSRGRADALCHALAVAACDRAGRWEMALALLERARAALPRPGAALLAAVAAACGRRHLWPVAVALLVEMRHRDRVMPDAFNVNVAVSACGAASRWALAWALLDEMERGLLARDVVGFNAALSASGRAKHRPVAAPALLQSRRVAPDARSYGGHPMLAVLSELEGGHLWREALRWLQEATLRRVQLDSMCYNAAIGACRRAAQWELALVSLREMRRERHGGLGGPDFATYSSVIRGVGARWVLALALLGESLILGATRSMNVFVLGAALRSCREGRQWQRALAVMEAAVEARSALDVLACNTALAACEEGRHWQACVALVAAMKHGSLPYRVVGGPNVVSFNTAMAACARGRAWTSALELLQQMCHVGPKPDIASFLAGIAACDWAGLWREALALLAVLPQHSLVPDDAVFATATSAVARAAQWRHALALLEKSGGVGDASATKAVQYNAAIAACERGRHWSCALDLLARMLEARMDTGGAHGYFPVLAAAARAGQTALATTLYKQAVAAGHLRGAGAAANRSGKR